MLKIAVYSGRKSMLQVDEEATGLGQITKTTLADNNDKRVRGFDNP